MILYLGSVYYSIDLDIDRSVQNSWDHTGLITTAL